MAKRYQNTAFASGSSEFTEVLGSQFVSRFSASSPTLKTSGGSVKLVNGKLSLVRQTVKTGCEECNPISFQESMRIEFNFDPTTPARLTEMRTELNRLYDEAVEDYLFSNGLVPPVYASFPEV